MVTVEWATNAPQVLLIDTLDHWTWSELGQALEAAVILLASKPGPLVLALALRDIRLQPGFTQATNKLIGLNVRAGVVWGETPDSWFAMQIVKEVTLLPYRLYTVREAIDLIPCAETIRADVIPTPELARLKA